VLAALILHIMTLLSTKVKGLREVKTLSQSGLADAVPVSKGYLSLLERGGYTNPGMKVLKGLAKALDVSIDYLVDDSSTENRSWERVAIDESMRIFLNKHDLSTEDVKGFRRISLQHTAPRTVAEWDRLLSNLNSFRQKAPDSNYKSRTDVDDQIVRGDPS